MHFIHIILLRIDRAEIPEKIYDFKQLHIDRLKFYSIGTCQKPKTNLKILITKVRLQKMRVIS